MHGRNLLGNSHPFLLDHPIPMTPDEDTGSYDLDVDDVVEDPNEVMREAVAAVEAVEAESSTPDSGPAASSDQTVAAAGSELDEDALFAASDSDDETVRQMRHAKMVELHERLLRSLADLENYRRRADREQGELKRYSGFELLREFLNVVDNLERALSAKGSVEDLAKGVEMIHRQMLDLLRRSGVERIEAEGMPFDPSVHDAVARGEDADVEEPMVINELQSGFRMYDRLLRPAMVRVAMPIETGQVADDDVDEPADEAVGE